MGAVDAKKVRTAGLRRTTTVTIGVAAASVVGALAFAGLAHAATQDAKSKAAGGNSSDPTQDQLPGTNAGDNRQIPSLPLFGGGGSRTNRGGAHASSGGS